MTTKSHNPADKVEHWPIDRLIPYARNARTHSQEQVAAIAASIAEFGFTNPILAGSDGVIVAEKNGRIARIMELDPRYCDVIVKRYIEFTGKQAIHADTGKTFAEVKHGDKTSETHN